MAVASIYGDSMARAPTKSIYTRHMDSANRDAPLTTTPSTYKIAVGGELRGVGTVQVGDVQLPTDKRSAIDYARRHYGLSEPLRLAAASTLTLQETTTVVNRASGAVTSTTVHPAVTLALPPTLNRVTAVAVDDVTVTVAAAHGLEAVVAYWPTALPAAMVGSRATNYTPLVSASTLDATTPLPSATQFRISAATNATWLTHTAAGTVGGMLVGAAANAWLEVPPLTVPEWVAVLNAALADFTAAGTLRNAYNLRVGAASGLVELQSQGGDVMSLTARSETTAAFTVASGDVMWRLGFPPGTWTLRNYANPALDYSNARVDTTSYVMAVAPRDLRTIQLPRGTYDAAGLAAALTTASCGVYVPATATTNQRTLHFTDATGVARTVSVPAGAYGVTQFTTLLASAMNAAPTVGGAFTVTAAVPSGTTAATAGSYAYTIADALGRVFSLDFATTGGDFLAGLLGFEPVKLTGAASYASSLQGTVGESTLGDRHAMPLWSADTTRLRLRLTAAAPLAAFEGAVAAAGAGNVSSVVFTLLGSGGATTCAPHLAVGDVVQLSDGTNTVTAVVATVPSGNVATGPVGTYTLDFGAVLQGVDLVIAATLETVTPLERLALVLHMAPAVVNGIPEDVTGLALVNATLPLPLAAVGKVAAYGPAYEAMGFAPTVTQTADSGLLLAPYAYVLEPPPYIFMELDAPGAKSERATFRPTRSGDAAHAVLAKFIVSNGFARITEESTHVTLTSPTTLSAVTVTWRNPDGTLVDWNGVNHSYALLFRVAEGHAGGMALA